MGELDAAREMANLREEVRKRATRLQGGVAQTSATRRVEPVQNADSATLYQQRLREEAEKNQVLVKAFRNEQIAQLEREWEARIEDRWRDAGLDKITDPEYSTPIKDRLERHATRSGLNRTSLVMSGQMGRGKTYLAYAYARELIRQGLMLPSQIFFDTERTLGLISNSGYKKADRMEALLNPHYRFFLIDDVGRGVFSSDSMRGEIWYELVNHIYTRRLTLVLTTNLLSKRDEGNKQTLAWWLGDAAIDRLRHMTGADGNIILKGDNMRNQLGEKWEEDHRKRSGK